MTELTREQIETLPSVRQHAIRINSTFYFTGKPCKNGHFSRRYAKSGKCVECTKQWDKNNPEKSYYRRRSWYLTNKDQADAASRNYAENNPDAARDRSARWRAEHAEYYARTSLERYYRNREDRLEYRRRWSQENKDKRSATEAKRRATKLQRTPSWANHQIIALIYADAAKAREDGVMVHVDHIIPLQGENVCGLHVENNLQTLPYRENISKGNKHD